MPEADPPVGFPERRAGWAVVLGASGVTGSAVARAVAESPGLDILGYHRGRHPEAAERLERSLRELGREVHLESVDASDADTIERLADDIATRVAPGTVRLFAHALAGAAVGRLATSGDTVAAARYERTFAVMAHSLPWWVDALHRRGLFAPQARIVAFSNPLVESLVRNTALIAASKAALEIYVRHLALELGPAGLRVNLVRFGAVLSPAVHATFGAEGALHMADVTARLGPAGRLCAPDEVGGLVSLLLDPRAAWFNGATIDFTGAEFQSLYDAILHPIAG